MRKFEICVKGRNFLIKEDDEAKKFGFYAARFIEAHDSSTAAKIAMDSFRAELKNIVMNDESDPPMMSVVEVREVYFFEDRMEVGEMVLSGKGFRWDEE